MTKVIPRVDALVPRSQWYGNQVTLPAPVGGGDALFSLLAPWAWNGVRGGPGPFNIY